MKYYVTDCITGTIEGVEPVGTLEEAVSIRDEWNAKRNADGGSDEFWIILDEEGNQYLNVIRKEDGTLRVKHCVGNKVIVYDNVVVEPFPEDTEDLPDEFEFRCIRFKPHNKDE